MNHINAFYNTELRNGNGFGISSIPIAAGDFFLESVRYLFHGETVTVTKIVTPTEEFQIKVENLTGPRSFTKTLLTIVLLAPAIILGTFFKAIGYLSSEIRQRHQIAALHSTPQDPITLGWSDEPWNLDEIKDELQQLFKDNVFQRGMKPITVYVEEGTKIEEDPGFLALNPEKVILIGKDLITNNTAGKLADKLVALNWEAALVQKRDKFIGSAMLGRDMTIADIKIKHISAHYVRDPLKFAEEHVPPVRSLIPFERYKCIYVIE